MGLPTGTFGVAWPAMRASIDAPLAALGLLLAASMSSYFLSTALTGALSRRLSVGTLVLSSAMVSALGLALFALAGTLWQVILAAFVLGAGNGALDAAMNAYVALSRGVRAMGVLHASWALGAALGPALVGASLALTGSWHATYALGALFFVAVGAWVRVSRSEWPRGEPEPVPAAATRGAAPALVFGAVLFFLYVGLEAAAGQWAFTDLADRRGLPPAAAGWAVSLYWSALAAGRFALGVGGLRLPARTMLDGSVWVSLAGAFAYWALPAPVAGLVALPLVALGLSAFLPLLLYLTPARVGPALATTAVGYQFAAGTVGGAAIPALVGIGMQSFETAVLGPSLAVLALVLATLHLLARRG